MVCESRLIAVYGLYHHLSQSTGIPIIFQMLPKLPAIQAAQRDCETVHLCQAVHDKNDSLPDSTPC